MTNKGSSLSQSVFLDMAELAREVKLALVKETRDDTELAYCGTALIRTKQKITFGLEDLCLHHFPPQSVSWVAILT